MSAFSEYIDHLMDRVQEVAGGNLTKHGFAEIVQRDGKRFPVCSQAGLGEKILHDSTKPVQAFVVLASFSEDRNNYDEKIISPVMNLYLIGVRSGLEHYNLAGIQELASDVCNSIGSGAKLTNTYAAEGAKGVLLNAYSEIYSGQESEDSLDQFTVRIRLNPVLTVCGGSGC